MKQKSLFKYEDPAQPRSESGVGPVIASIDGGARGNPGPAAYGVIIRNGKGELLAELSAYLGHQTNNFAEYSGLLAALDYAVREKIASLKVRSDSELLVRQMKGVYKVKHPALKELFREAQSLAQQLEHFSIEHRMREQNKEADRLVNKVLDSRK